MSFLFNKPPNKIKLLKDNKIKLKEIAFCLFLLSMNGYTKLDLY